MAYVFNFNTNNLTGKEEEPGVVQKSQLLPQSGGVSVKTSTPTVKASTPTQQTASGGIANVAPAPAAAHNDAIPRSINSIGDTITKNQADLQQRSNDFLNQTRAANDYGVTTGDLNMVAKGDQAAQSKIGGILSQTTSRPVGQFDAAYKAPEGLDNLSTQAGLANVARAGQNSEFTPGEAAFDAGQISRDPAFQKAYKELRGRDADLRQVSQKTQDETQKAAQGIADEELANTQKNIRDWLQKEMGNMTSGNALEADQANGALNGLDLNAIAQQQVGGAVPGAIDAAMAKLGGRSSKQVQDAAKSLTEGQLGDYVNRHKDYTAQDFVSKDEANAYNAMLNTLGQGGDSWSASGDLGPQYTFNNDRFSSDLYGNALNARMGLDETNSAEIQKLLGNVQGFVDEGNKGLQSQISGYGDTLGNIAQGYLGEHGDLSSYYDPSMINDYTQANPLTYNPYTVDNYMPEAEAGALNSLSTDLGLPANYQRGQRALGDSGPEDLINDDRFKDWLGSQLGGKKSAADSAASAKAQSDADAEKQRQEAADAEHAASHPWLPVTDNYEKATQQAGDQWWNAWDQALPDPVYKPIKQASDDYVGYAKDKVLDPFNSAVDRTSSSLAKRFGW